MFIVGIAGGSGSGKTTFTEKVLDGVDQEKVQIIHQDSYYLAQPPQNLTIDGALNFDHPDAFDWELLRYHLKQLKSGKSIEMPVYDFKTNRRTNNTVTINPGRALLFEGIFALWDPKLRDHFDIKVFLNVDADIRFIRRLHRDVQERGRSIDGIIRQYYDTVRPMYVKFLGPTMQYADFIVGEESDIAASILAARLNHAII